MSSQLHLEALAQSVGKVWTLSPTFRAEKSDTARHLSEFYMLEAEAAFVDRLEDLLSLVERMLRSLVGSLESSPISREIRDYQPPPGTQPFAIGADHRVPAEEVAARWRGILAPSRWPRITYAEAVRLLSVAAPTTDAFGGPPTWESGLSTEHEKWLAVEVGGAERQPIFVTDYPRIQKPFYMRSSTSPSSSWSGATTTAGKGGRDSAADDTVACFDLLVPDLCEIAGGSMRHHVFGDLQSSMGRAGLLDSDGNAGQLSWYLDLRRFGCPPHGGFGLGFDRLLAYLAGVRNVRDVVSFPRWHGRCDC